MVIDCAVVEDFAIATVQKVLVVNHIALAAVCLSCRVVIDLAFAAMLLAQRKFTATIFTVVKLARTLRENFLAVATVLDVLWSDGATPFSSFGSLLAMGMSGFIETPEAMAAMLF